MYCLVSHFGSVNEDNGLYLSSEFKKESELCAALNEVLACWPTLLASVSVFHGENRLATYRQQLQQV